MFNIKMDFLKPATHLKARFPKLKIGGPASAYREDVEIKLDFGALTDKFEMLLLDAKHNCEGAERLNSGSVIKMSPNTACLLRSI